MKKLYYILITSLLFHSVGVLQSNIKSKSDFYFDSQNIKVNKFLPSYYLVNNIEDRPNWYFRYKNTSQIMKIWTMSKMKSDELIILTKDTSFFNVNQLTGLISDSYDSNNGKTNEFEYGKNKIIQKSYVEGVMKYKIIHELEDNSISVKSYMKSELFNFQIMNFDKDGKLFELLTYLPTKSKYEVNNKKNIIYDYRNNIKSTVDIIYIGEMEITDREKPVNFSYNEKEDKTILEINNPRSGKSKTIYIFEGNRLIKIIEQSNSGNTNTVEYIYVD